MYISVSGSSHCEDRFLELAYSLGREIAARGHVMVCGGLSGVMEAASRGVRDGGGVSIGILPGPDRSRANPWLTFSIPTDMGHARNTLVALAGDAVIAVCGGYGTLSEVALALKMGKPVVGLDTWDLDSAGREPTALMVASSPAEAVGLVEQEAAGGSFRRPDYGVD